MTSVNPSRVPASWLYPSRRCGDCCFLRQRMNAQIESTRLPAVSTQVSDALVARRMNMKKTNDCVVC